MTRHGILTAAGGVLPALALLPALWPADAAAAVCPETDSVQLTVGQTNDAGDVKVCNDDTTLTITYEATYPFCLLETDLHVALRGPDADPDANIPQNRQGRPTPDQFAYGDEYDPCVGTDTFEIPLDEIGEEGVIPGESVVIAAHAKLEDEDGKVEEAWGQGTRFVPRGGNWAMYFTYTIQQATLTGCVCDEVLTPEERTGAEVLAALCPDGVLRQDARILESTTLSLTFVEGPGGYYTASSSPPARCGVGEHAGPGGTTSRFITAQEAEACRAHLRGSCGP